MYASQAGKKARDGYRAANAGALAAAAYPLRSAARAAGEGPLVSHPQAQQTLMTKKLTHAMVVIESETSTTLHNHSASLTTHQPKRNNRKQKYEAFVQAVKILQFYTRKHP